MTSTKKMETEKNNDGIKLNVIDPEKQTEIGKKEIIPKKHSDEIKVVNIFKKIQFWQALSVIFIILFIVSLFFITSNANSISKTEAKNKVQAYVDRILAGRAVAEIGNIDEKNGLYSVQLTLQGQNVESYITKDGELFFPAAVELDKITNLPLPTNDASAEGDNVIVEEVSIDDDPVLGNENAPVTMVEFSDFQCPFCGTFRRETFNKIKEEYIDTNKIKLIYRDFPLREIHPFAQKAAEAAECADEQGKFWEYHDILFENQQKLDDEDLKKYAADLKLDTSEFNDCLESGKMTEEVNKDYNEGSSYGIDGTPAFFINGISLSGALPFESFKTIIDKELAKA